MELLAKLGILVLKETGYAAATSTTEHQTHQQQEQGAGNSHGRSVRSGPGRQNAGAAGGPS
jgi:hypothetical protein